MKKCNECGEIKPFSEYHKSKNAYQYKCKKCIRVIYKKRYASQKAKILKQNSKYRRDNKDRMRRLVNEWRERNPDKRLAHIAVMNALVAGKITKKPCCVCGIKKEVEAHHASYRPEDRLKVKWLCRKHHIELHNNLRNQDE